MFVKAVLALAAVAMTAAAFPTELEARSGVQYEAYLSNACNGEALYGGTLTKGKCVDVSEYREASSLVISGFTNKKQNVHFYFDADCKDQVGNTKTEQCYIVDSDTKAIKLTG